jgi:pimeloyl-ACP methyl ester carboxylesterase
VSRLRSGAGTVLVACLLVFPTSVARADSEGVLTAAGAPVPVPELSYEPCGTTPEGTAADVQCATAELPLDYDQPDGDQVQIALAKVPATQPDQRIGSLFFDLGGPGADSVDLLQSRGSGPFAALNQRFDIIGFDPRGVGQSTPAVDCQVNQETDGLTPRPSPVPDDVDADALVARAQRYVDECLANNGDILEHLSTANVARDMDVLRAAVGDEKLTYLGFSYGTFLGATYAALFPDRYRALVLDGALDPDAYLTDPVALSTAQGTAFERALERFLVACMGDATACSGFGADDGDTDAAYNALLASADETPIPAPRFVDDPRPVVADDIRSVTLVLLYSKQTWGLLAAALAQAEKGDASLVRALVDLVVYPRNDDGSYDPQSDRFFTIAGSEQQWPTDVDSYLDRGAKEYVDVPHFWAGFAYSEIAQALWPAHDEDAYDGPFTVPDSSVTPLVLGTTFDPATPYPGAEAMVDALGNARLLTMEGDGHTAYGQDNSTCIDQATENYLIDGTVPDEGTVCKQEVPFTSPSAPTSAGTAEGTALPAITDALGAVPAGSR